MFTDSRSTGRLGSDVTACLEAVSDANVWRSLERETGIEPATNSLEGCDSTTELLPPTRSPLPLATLSHAQRPLVPCLARPGHRARTSDTVSCFGAASPPVDAFRLPSRSPPGTGSERRLVARGGFEPPKAGADRFTVCCV